MSFLFYYHYYESICMGAAFGGKEARLAHLRHSISDTELLLLFRLSPAVSSTLYHSRYTSYYERRDGGSVDSRPKL